MIITELQFHSFIHIHTDPSFTWYFSISSAGPRFSEFGVVVLFGEPCVGENYDTRVLKILLEVNTPPEFVSYSITVNIKRSSRYDSIDPERPRGTVVGVDLLNIPPLEGAHFLSSHDVTDPATHAKLLELLPNGCAGVILSDMAPNASGFRDMDHEKLITLCLALIDLAAKVLQPGGSLVCKYWDGILARKLQEKLSNAFGSVRILKPDASRKDSAERYFLARMYKKPIK